MPLPIANDAPRGRDLEGKSLEELLLLIGDEEKGYKPEALDRLLAMGFDAIYPRLEQAVRNDDNADLRNSAMEVLVTSGRRSVPRLIALLKDDNEEVRNFSSVMLGDIGSREAVGALVHSLSDPDVNVRHAAAEALGKIGDRAALLPLIELLKGEFWVQYAAIAAFGAMRDYRAVPHLLELLDTELLTLPVVEALGKIGDPRALKPLAAILPEVDAILVGIVTNSIVAICRELNESLSYKNRLVEYNSDRLKHLISESGVARIRNLLAGGGDRESVEAAVTLLGWLGEAEAIDDFFRLLVDDGLMKVVENAILAIGTAATPMLQAALSHDNDNVAVVALHSLRWMGEPGEPDSLTALLDRTNPEVQLEALESLREIPSEAILPRLLPFFEQGGEELCLKSAEALGRYPLARLRPYLQTLCTAENREKRRRGALLLGFLKDGGDPELLKALIHDEQFAVRKEAIRVVGIQQVKTVLPAMGELLSDPDSRIKEAAVTALAEFGTPLFLEEILHLLGTGDEALDYAVIRAAGRMGSPEGGAALMEFLGRVEVSRRILYAILETFGRISYKPASEPVVTTYLQHPDPDIRRLAVELLGNLGDRQSLKGVETAAGDPHWSVRIAALHVLGKIGGALEIPLILAAMKDQDRMVRKHAIITLGELREVTTVPDLVRQLTDMEMSRYAFEALLKFGRMALPWLHRLMKKDFSLEVRERVIDLIGKIGERRSVEPLLGLLDDPSPVIRLATIDSLAFCFDSVPLKKLVQLKCSDTNVEVKERADLALKTFMMEKYC